MSFYKSAPLIGAFFTLAALAAASPSFSSCDSGTLDQYIALGSTGCQFNGILWSNFEFSATNNGSPVDPNAISIVFSGLSFTGTGNITVLEGTTLDLNFGFAVTGPTRLIMASETLAPPTPGVLGTISGCENGTFSGSNCSGTLLPDSHVFYLFDPTLADQVALRFSQQDVGQPGNSTFTQIFGEIQSIPEPSAFVLAGSGLLIAGIFRARFISRS